MNRESHNCRSRTPRTRIPGFRLFLRVFATSLLLWFTLIPAFSATAASLKEDDLLLLDFVLEQQRLARSVTGYTLGDSAVVSLAETGAALEFPIVVDAAAGTARGSFIRAERTFALDLNAGFVEIEGKRLPITADEAFRFQDGIFIPVKTLSRWFPVDLNFQPETLTVDIQPRERLPIQEREARRRAAQQSVSIGPATLPLIETPYRLLGRPVADIGLGYTINRNINSGSPSAGLNYSALVAGDLAYMDAHLYLSGDNNDPLSQARMSLSRDKLGLPLGLRYVEVGDIVPAIVPGLSYTGVERGILIQGGGSVSGRDDLIGSDVMNLSGEALEGWDVELFQNGMRIGFQTVGVDGRYNFMNIDPLAGKNVFDLVFYGPAGERRTETLIRYGGLEPDMPGSVRYQLSASQKGQQLYNLDGNTTTNLSDIGSSRLAGSMNVRVLPNLSVRGSWNNLMLDGQRLNYYSLGTRTTIRDITFSADATLDPIHGTRWDASMQLPAKTRIWGFDTRFSHTQYVNSTLTEAGNEANLSSRTGVSLTGPIGKTTSQFSLFHNRTPTVNSNTAAAGFTARINKVAFGNTLNYSRYDANANGVRSPDTLTGNAFLNAQANPLSLRAGISYALKPEAEARQYFIDSNLTVAKDMSMNFALSHTPLDGITRYITGLNWQLPQVTLSPRLTYYSDGRYDGFLYAAFSLAPRPDRAGGVLVSGPSLASAATVAARVFLDQDGSSTYTPGDELLPDVTVRAPQVFRAQTTNAEGMALLTGLSSTRATDVVVDPQTLPSPQMTSTHPGNSVRPRPTALTLVDFPVIATGEIYGHVYAMRLGQQVPLAGALVELRASDGKVVGFKTSEHDGYFEFTELPYADYVLNLAGDQRTKANQPKVVINRERNVHADIDLVIAGKPAVPPPVAAPVAEQAPPAPLPPPAIIPEQKPAPLPPAVPATAPAPAPVTEPAKLAAVPAAAALPKPLDDRLVQLGAFANSEKAQAYRQKLLLSGSLKEGQVEIVTVDLGAHGRFHRVVATPAGTTAETLCSSLKTTGVSCFTIDR